MAKLYIFGIGGTGSRVLRALTMLMASGVKVQDSANRCYEIVPIVIDPDHAAADLTRTVKLIRDYKKVRNTINFDTESANNFFRNDINLTVISGPTQVERIAMSLGNTQNVDFKTYIGLASMRRQGQENANFALASMLFSENNLNSRMDVGFKGNPNIGSVVLNQFGNSDEFHNFAASFGQNDRIFIISSIFGGTGASGFPLLLKNLRTISDDNMGHIIKTAPIGAVSVLPYFAVAPDNNPEEQQRSQIDSSTFISKTKAALAYYDKNMKEANILYYIGDNISKQYANSEGGNTQQNDAHFIELASALAIVDFARIPNEQLITNIDPATNNGVPVSTTYKEFGIVEETESILFSNLDINTVNLIKKPMTQFLLFCKYLQEQIHDSKKGGKNQQPWAIDNQFDDSFLSSVFYLSDLNGIITAYLGWLQEMSDNQRNFSPYELELPKNQLFYLIKGERPKKTWFSNNYALFDEILNSQRITGTKEHKFIGMFFNATEKIVTNKKFNM
jgi:hypothetical protein